MDKIKVLFLAANPTMTSSLRLDEEIREITAKIRASEHRDNLELISAWAVQPDDILQLLNQHKPHIVHFSGHGSSSKELLFVGNDGSPKLVSAKALKAVFSTLKDNIRLVFLNACHSKAQSTAITEVVDCFVGMRTTIGDGAAITFASSFYRAIGFGCTIQGAYDQGIAALLLENSYEAKTPKLLMKKDVDPSTIMLINPQKLDKYAFNEESDYIRKVVSLCYRKSLFAKSDDELSLKAMFASLSECLKELQKIVVFVPTEDMNRLVVGIISDLMIIEMEQKHLSYEMFDRIDSAKLRIIEKLTILAKFSHVQFIVPTSLLETKRLKNKADADAPPFMK